MSPDQQVTSPVLPWACHSSYLWFKTAAVAPAIMSTVVRKAEEMQRKGREGTPVSSWQRFLHSVYAQVPWGP